MNTLKHITGQYRYVVYLLALPVFVLIWVFLQRQLDSYIRLSINFNSSSFLYPLFLFSKGPWSNLFLGLTVPAIAVIITILSLKKHKFRRRVQVSSIVLAFLVVVFSSFGSFVAAFTSSAYEPVASIQIENHTYQILVVHGGWGGRCDPYCYPDNLLMLTCDSAMIICEKTGFVGYEDYHAHRMFCTGVCSEPKVSIQFDETSQEITITVNERDIKTFSLEM